MVFEYIYHSSTSVEPIPHTNVSKLNFISIDSPWSVLVPTRKKSMKNYWTRAQFKSMLTSVISIVSILNHFLLILLLFTYQFDFEVRRISYRSILHQQMLGLIRKSELLRCWSRCSDIMSKPLGLKKELCMWIFSFFFSRSPILDAWCI